MDPQDLDHINQLLDHDVNLREKIKDQATELDKKARTMVGLLNKIHSTPTNAVPALIESVRPVLHSCKDVNAGLVELIPPSQFWRWKDQWANALRTAIFSASLVEYLATGKLISLSTASEVLGIREEWSDRLAISAEDYLHGIISLVNELSRLAINSVTLGNFEEPIRISIFVKDIFAGFAMLNLKNDTLRRRYDSLKYDIKKIEEVVYDVSLRKLASTPIKEAIAV